ncbi:hypothetical protein ASPWEDRAFT_28874 [Aspergillus wentii DTO 134E9]|uniref:Glycosyl hydrolase family 32 N-terminal domain-containing protein n=1 Tax=Aspergillus wentii DTO 134E9 TaxID=1073089 RepID=A0A1L9RFG4_ASPWE|nr:uncharacterized protein ASPWEDRAFT_28874 [Aspergillus wentii DTO 134E9]KAI9925429.1 hypothetical protein MW887_005810 [Aspergillus wentii]OJJ33662.1 hypothetical protein ASPWEDRAFT_28874 [Aspergillus wentii DTO 134E9]
MKFSYIASLLSLCSISLSHPLSNLQKKADSTKAGYLAVYWTTANESVYFALSDNDNPLGFQAIHDSKPIVSPTLGTGAVRDVSIIAGAGDDADQKWYIIGTDLNIDDTTWGDSTRTGSRGILVWESTDLVNWTGERLVTVEDDTAGMVWAPDAIWDPDQSKYLVHWASQLYSADDTDHTGDATTTQIIRYAYTSDFKTFTTPKTWIDLKTASTIDLSILPVSDSTYVRFYVNGNTTGPVVEVSTNGLLGDWTAPDGSVKNSASYEGPYPFWDNTVDGKAYLLNDAVGSSPGLAAWTSTDVTSGNFDKDSSSDLTFMRHGSVLAITQDQYDALKAL